MKGIVIISGPPGVGKTATSQALALAMPEAVCIHGDVLRAFAPKDAPEHLGGGSTYRAGAALALEYLKMGARAVLFDYVFSRPSHVAYFVNRLEAANSPQVFLFTLWAPLELVQLRESRRVGRDRLGARVEQTWTEIAASRSALGEFVDASELNPTAMASVVIDLVQRGVGGLALGVQPVPAQQVLAGDAFKATRA